MENLIKELDKAEKRAKTSRDKIYTSIDGLIAAVDRSKTEVDQLVGIFLDRIDTTWEFARVG